MYFYINMFIGFIFVFNYIIGIIITIAIIVIAQPPLQNQQVNI